MKQIVVYCGGVSTPNTMRAIAEVGYKETTVTWVGQGNVVVSDTHVPITDDIAAALMVAEQLAIAHEVDTAYERFSCEHRRRRRTSHNKGGRR